MFSVRSKSFESLGLVSSTADYIAKRQVMRSNKGDQTFPIYNWCI
jgi:hypothetical protein